MKIYRVGKARTVLIIAKTPPAVKRIVGSGSNKWQLSGIIAPAPRFRGKKFNYFE